MKPPVPPLQLPPSGILFETNLCDVQGALWVYEALFSPGLKRARTEISKFPALENALKQLNGQPQKVQVSMAKGLHAT